MHPRSTLFLGTCLAVLAGGAHAARPAPDYYGTLEPFARDAVYFVVTDRFVNGDPSNDHRDQGGQPIQALAIGAASLVVAGICVLRVPVVGEKA